MRLFIAEQPSVATDLVKILGGDFRCYDDYFESATDIVSCCITYPAEIKTCQPPNRASKEGNIDNLLHPPPHPFRERESALSLLLERKDISVIVHCATDNDESSQWINTLRHCADILAPIKRALIYNSSSPVVKQVIRML